MFFGLSNSQVILKLRLDFVDLPDLILPDHFSHIFIESSMLVQLVWSHRNEEGKLRGKTAAPISNRIDLGMRNFQKAKNSVIARVAENHPLDQSELQNLVICKNPHVFPSNLGSIADYFVVPKSHRF
jgi:hypothetical protein